MNTPLPIPEQYERGPPSHFAGRKPELEAMQGRLDAVLADPKAAMMGMLLLTGVPGIGKTFLLEHFAARAEGNKRVRVLKLNPTHLTSAEGLLVQMDEALGKKDKFVKAAGIDGKITGVRAGVPGVSGGVTLDAHRPSLEFAHRLQATSGHKVWRDKVLLVTIDEIQNMDSRSTDQVGTLHFGQHGCPIVVVAAGLQHSRAVLGDMKISRMTHRRLSLLSDEESSQAIYHGLRNLGVDVTEDTAERLAQASMRFPQHIQMHIDAARRVHNEGRDVNGSDAIADVLSMGRIARMDYYEGRLAAMKRGDELFPLVDHMTQRNIDAITQTEAKSIVDGEVLSEAVQHGVLSQSANKSLFFGISSFRSYMIQQANELKSLT